MFYSSTVYYIILHVKCYSNIMYNTTVLIVIALYYIILNLGCYANEHWQIVVLKAAPQQLIATQLRAFYTEWWGLNTGRQSIQCLIASSRLPIRICWNIANRSTCYFRRNVASNIIWVAVYTTVFYGSKHHSITLTLSQACHMKTFVTTKPHNNYLHDLNNYHYLLSSLFIIGY